MASIRRRDRAALGGLLAVTLVAGLFSAAVDHHRSGGPILPASQTIAAPAPHSAGAKRAAAANDAAVDALVDLFTGGGFDSPAPAKSALPAAPPAPLGGPRIPPPPPNKLDAINLPAPVKQLTQLSAPLGFAACQYLGLLPLVVALGGALGAPVDLGDYLPYLQPLFTACLVIGVPDTETTCAVDQRIDDGVGVPPIPVALDLTLDQVIEAIPVPTPFGLFIDEMVGLERLALGPPKPGEAPRFSDRLLAALDCSQRP